MSVLVEKMEAALEQSLEQLAAAGSAADIEQVKNSMLGRQGFLPAAMKELRDVPPEEKPQVGKAANIIKLKFTQALQDKTEALASADAQSNAIDVTMPPRRRYSGHKHPISQTIDDCVKIFRRMGFVTVEGPEIEDEYHNFDALNTPADHPSRDSQDTFYLLDGMLLRTQTSPVQIRVMEKQDPPVRIICPGRCFRKDAPDATHSMNFSQIEGLYINKNGMNSKKINLRQKFHR